MEETLVRPIIEYLVDRMAKRIAAGEPCDIVRDLSLPLTYKVMATLLGLPNDTLTDFVHWGDAMFNAATDMEAGMNGAVSLSQMFYAELEKRRTTPGDDLLTWMLEAEAHGSRLDDDEIVTHARFFLPAGIETTSRSVSLTLLTLLEDRSRYEEVTARPELIHAAVEECSRYATGGFVAGRRAVKDTVVAGVEIPARSLMLHVQGLCNRDPARWEDPDTFNMHRPHKAHLLFNMGIHTCAGMHLARLELEGSVRALIERLPGLHLAVPREEIAVRGFQIRTPLHVPVTAL
jgi:cytochrome P450